MGWRSDLGSTMIKSIKKNIKDENIKRKIYKDLIDALEDADCDTLNDCEGIDKIFDKVLDQHMRKFYSEDYE